MQCRIYTSLLRFFISTLNATVKVSFIEHDAISLHIKLIIKTTTDNFLLRLFVMRVSLCAKYCFYTGHFVMVALNLTLSALFATFVFECRSIYIMKIFK